MPRKNKYRTEQTNAMTESHQSEEKTLKTIQKGETTLELQQISVRLLTYTGETIPVLGSVVVPVEPNGQTRILLLIVTEGSGPFLLDRDWLSALRLVWKAIFSAPASTRQVQQCVQRGPGLGELREVKAKIYVDKDERPRFFKPRQVPFAIRQKVEEELERLQAGEILRLGCSYRACHEKRWSYKNL